MALLTVPEVARELRVTGAHVYVLIAEGLLRSVRIGRAVRVEEDALRAFIAKGGERRTTSGRRSA
jgi:excisionase family DNA binding protein